MLYTQLIDLIRATANDTIAVFGGKGSFIHTREDNETFEVNSLISPIINLMPFRSQDDYNQRKQTFRLIIRFLSQDTLDSSPLDQEKLLKKVEKLQATFFDFFFNKLKTGGNVDKKAIYRNDSLIATGFECQFYFDYVFDPDCDVISFGVTPLLQDSSDLLLNDNGASLFS